MRHVRVRLEQYLNGRRLIVFGYGKSTAHSGLSVLFADSAEPLNAPNVGCGQLRADLVAENAEIENNACKQRAKRETRHRYHARAH